LILALTFDLESYFRYFWKTEIACTLKTAVHILTRLRRNKS